MVAQTLPVASAQRQPASAGVNADPATRGTTTGAFGARVGNTLSNFFGDLIESATDFGGELASRAQLSVLDRVFPQFASTPEPAEPPPPTPQNVTPARGFPGLPAPSILIVAGAAALVGLALLLRR